MNKLITIGEALIDFIPFNVEEVFLENSTFIRLAGGAPFNVTACVAKLGGVSTIITKLGEDFFGDYIINLAKNINIDIKNIYRTNEANTALAFVQLNENGERKFSFYRKPSADMLLNENEISEESIKEGKILHFCSVSLVDFPIKKAHLRAINYAKKNNLLISFDPNVRLPLWESSDECRRVINEFIPYADILKVSDEELEFITGISDINESIKKLLEKVSVIIYTLGDKGVRFITKDEDIYVNSFKVKVIDTTGAGDAFIGSFLYQILEKGYDLNDLLNLKKDEIEKMLLFSNATSAYVVSKKGAIDALPTKKEVLYLVENGEKNE